MPATANTTALILLRIGFALAATLAILFLLMHSGSRLPFGAASLYVAALAGGSFILRELRALVRDLAAAPDAPGRLSPR